MQQGHLPGQKNQTEQQPEHEPQPADPSVDERERFWTQHIKNAANHERVLLNGALWAGLHPCRHCFIEVWNEAAIEAHRQQLGAMRSLLLELVGHIYALRALRGRPTPQPGEVPLIDRVLNMFTTDPDDNPSDADEPGAGSGLSHEDAERERRL